MIIGEGNVGTGRGRQVFRRDEGVERTQLKRSGLKQRNMTKINKIKINCPEFKILVMGLQIGKRNGIYGNGISSFKRVRKLNVAKRKGKD